MNRTVRRLLICVGLSICLLQAPTVNGGGEEFENLEFFLDQYLKETQDPSQRGQIMDRYTIKALGLLYKQNAELIRLNGEALKALQQLVGGQGREIMALEHQIRELRNEMKGRFGSPASSGAPSEGPRE